MKRALCLVLALVLILALGMPAAAESAEEQLKRVTLRVKTTLDIGDDYDSFNGDSYTLGGATWWRLYWEKEDESLYVTCDDNGKVYSFDRYDYNEDYSYSSGLHFPAFGYAEALAEAEAFLPRVLGEGEGFLFREQPDRLRNYGRYYLSGTLTLNGVPTEAGISLNFRTSDGSLTSFRRDDAESFITGGVPSPTPAVTPEQAMEALRGALSTSLSWSYSDYEKHEVRLTYFVNLDYNVMVDAQTGALLDRWDGGMRGGYANGFGAEPEEAPAAADENKGLTPYEIAAAEKFEGVLDGEALKAAAMAEEAFGITEDYVLGTVTYRAAQPSVDPAELPEGEEADDTVTATFRLSKALTGAEFGLSLKEYNELVDSGYAPTVWKTFTADARTGEVQSVYTSYSGFGWREEKEEAADPAISETALRFLEKRYGDWLPLCEQTWASQSRWSVPVNSFTYTRMEAGFPCPMNTISVSVNAATGYVDSFSATWDEEMTFGPSGPLVGEEAAMDSFLACYEAKLCYVTVPEDKDNWESPRHWLLVYLPDSGSGWVSGIDAVTGQADYSDWSYESAFPRYDDLADSYARTEIETLAKYGIGWYGVDKFQPTARVTELDMILLMLSAVGWQPDYETYHNASKEELDSLYSSAYYQGFIATREQDPDRPVTRTELCRCFVSLSGMQEAAALKGIFACGFSDEDQIPEEDLGYVAIAKGLGVVQGDRSGAFRPADGATRQELAVMLYRYLSR